MRKRALISLVVIIVSVSVSGCWNYRGLDQMNMVIGIAVDYDDENEMLKVSYEVADLAGAEKDKGPTGRVITSTGKTIFDAGRNAKKKEADRLFFGTTYIIIISQQVAEKKGISSIIEWFLQDAECRQTTDIIISQECSAHALLDKEEKKNNIISQDLHEIVTEDKGVSGTVHNIEIYEAYNSLHSKSKSVLLPAVHISSNNEKKNPELNGSAIIKDDKLVGYLTSEESRYALFAQGKVKSAVLPLRFWDDQSDDISLEVFSEKAKKTFRVENGKIIVSIKLKTHVALAENQKELDVMNEDLIRKIESAASDMIESKTLDVIKKLQQEYKTDALDFGELIYKKDLPLWKKISASWNEIYPNVDVEISSKVIIDNSAAVK